MTLEESTISVEIRNRIDEESLDRMRRQAENLPDWMAVKDERMLRLLVLAGEGGSY